MTSLERRHQPFALPADFAVTIGRDLGRVRVRVVGELDAWTAPALTDALNGLQDRTGIPTQRQPVVELDLSRLSFLDSAGVSALSDSRLALLTSGWRLRLVRAQPHISRLLAYAATAGWLAEDVLEPRTG